MTIRPSPETLRALAEISNIHTIHEFKQLCERNVRYHQRHK